MIELTACPECGQPAEVLWHSILESTDGPIEHARVLCISQHGFFLPVDQLPVIAQPAPERESIRVRRDRPRS
jgi:hypothetical protein